MRLNFNTYLLFFLLYGLVGFAQTRFIINDFNYYTIKDTVSNIIYSFDTGSEDSNLFDKKNINYKLGGLTLLSNASGTPKLARKAKIKHKFTELGLVQTKANILGDEDFAKKNCISVDLLLGTREIRKHILHFNNKNSVLTKLDRLPLNINEYRKLELSYNIFDDCYYVELEINGIIEKFLIDTADSYGISLKSNKNLSKHTDSYRFLSLAAFKTEVLTVLRFDENIIKHKGNAFNTTVVYQNEKYDNIIGNAFFLNFEEVIFDLKNKAIYLLNEYNSFDPFSEDILFTPIDENSFEIIYIKDSSEIYKNGFRVGDKIALKDNELKNKLLSSPCDTRLILKEWRLKNNTTLHFTKL